MTIKRSIGNKLIRLINKRCFIAQVNLWKAFGLKTAISKMELFYILPFGPAAWLCGLRYIDRSSTKAAYQTLENVKRVMIQGRTKILIYPEGTRDPHPGFVQFKKGAFITAIQAQVPIIPMVIAPYYYMDTIAEICFFHKSKSKYSA